ncbi:hypothetical protein [Pseudoflavonifractor sp. 524-17]|uniref:hypothetical protein n=1 Tax=Pseudoflavonifractor sp. 524-17 TaxID=2304577 RepID=UPI0013796F30|nr:hypothetical protein [Pseudoflavonifractor sp. 524-17]
MILCPFEGCGDAYLMGRLFDEYLRKERIDTEYIVIQPSEVGGRILKLFGIAPIECISCEEKNAILAFGAFIGFTAANMTVFHFNSGIHTGIMNCVEGIHNIDFFSMFSLGRLNLDVLALRVPHFVAGAFLKRKLIGQGVREGKTVILFPRSNSIPSPSEEFWKKLSIELKRKGYIVCTNVIYDEEPVYGTIPLQIPIEEIEGTLCFAGCFIGSRSGICEVVSSVDCKKIVIYPYGYRWGSGYVDEYFNIRNMQLCADMIEISYSQEKMLLAQILCHF